LRVCYECKTVTRCYTNPYQMHPCLSEHKLYDYANENQRKINDKDEMVFVKPVDQNGDEIGFEQMTGEIPDWIESIDGDHDENKDCKTIDESGTE